MKNISTLLGLIAAFASVILTLLIEGGKIASFINLSAMTLIFGGCAAVGVVSFSLKEFFAIPKYFMYALTAKAPDFKELILTFVSLSEKARREGLLALEEDVENIKDKMMKMGLALVVDGVDPEIIGSILEDYSDSMKHEEKTPAEFFECMGGFSPTLGIIGTVMGLVHVLEGLGSETGAEAIGAGIAVAFIATFYGIGFANLVLLPLSNRIKYLNQVNDVKRHIIVAGLLTIQRGDNPRIVKDRLLVLIPDEEVRKSINEETKT
jgi:chemotaxis protein MotA